ncbi:hypothetical protein [Kribbella soli]|uniref:hypothetical protein n=1 Tax=Kribbella soli TaxID=1124743 RepID=UPI00192D2D60|nr:hypothetical protein [Kribbella soli]
MLARDALSWYAERPLRASRQRRYENLAARRQGRLWQADIGLAELPPYPFACECGTAGCAVTWPGTPDEYDVRRGKGWLTAHPAC